MSYILDALRKSEKDRKRGTPPGIAETQEYSLSPGKRRSFLPYIIVGLLCMNALVLFVWLSPWKKSDERAIIGQQVAKPPATETGEAAAPLSALQETKSTEPAGIRKEPVLNHTAGEKPPAAQIRPKQEKMSEFAMNDIRSVSPPSPVVSSQDTRVEEPLPAAPPDRRIHEEEAVSKAVPSSPPVPVPAPEKGRIYSLQELPHSIQQFLPPFEISVALYSEDPGSRMVKINNQTLREGESLAEGLRLLEIRQDGVIFSYKDYKFRIGLN